MSSISSGPALSGVVFEFFHFPSDRLIQAEHKSECQKQAGNTSLVLICPASQADDDGSALVSEYSSLSVSWPIYLECVEMVLNGSMVL